MHDNNISFEEILEKNIWAETLARLPTSSPFMFWSWGEYKRRIGWSVHRVCIHDSGAGSVIGCFQLQKKKRGLLTILLVQGGIHVNELSDTNYHKMLQSFLQTYVTNKMLTIAIVSHLTNASQEVELGLLRSKFSPVLNSKMYTYIFDLKNKAITEKALSANWRHNLKRALNNSKLSTKWIDDPSDRLQSINRLEQWYTNLTSRKDFARAIKFGLAKDIIIENDEFRIVEAWLDNEVIATRVGLFCKDHVLDFLAASDDAAKKTYANYLLLWEMIRMAHSKGKTYFDCGGIDPAASMGVYNFKKGLGGRLVNGPIWIHGSGFMVKQLGRLLLSLKN